jgi:hypothetical protein
MEADLDADCMRSSSAISSLGGDIERMHATTTPVAKLKPGHGKTHRAYLWSYCSTRFSPMQAAVFDFAESRGGQHVRAFLGLSGQDHPPGWAGRMVTDDFSGYKACLELPLCQSKGAESRPLPLTVY